LQRVFGVLQRVFGVLQRVFGVLQRVFGVLKKAVGAGRFASVAVLAVVLTGCTSAPRALNGSRPFYFERDTFAYANELVWEYRFDERGRWTSKPRQPKTEYTHHCFVVARSAKQFFLHARFDPDRPVTDSETYRQLIRTVVSISPHKELPDGERIVIPAYANLREFSQAQEK